MDEIKQEYKQMLKLRNKRKKKPTTANRKPRKPKPTKEELIKMYEALPVVANYERLIIGSYSVTVVHDVDVLVGNDTAVILQYHIDKSVSITAQIHSDPVNEQCAWLDLYEYEIENRGGVKAEITAKIPYWLAKSFVSDLGCRFERRYTWGSYATFGNGVKKALGRDAYEDYSSPNCSEQDEKAVIGELLDCLEQVILQDKKYCDQNQNRGERLAPHKIDYTFERNKKLMSNEIAMYESLEPVDYELLENAKYETGVVINLDVEVKDNDMALVHYWVGHCVSVTVQINPFREIWKRLKPYQYEMITKASGNKEYPMITTKIPYYKVKELVNELGYKLGSRLTSGTYAEFEDGTKKALDRDATEYYYPQCYSPLKSEQKELPIMEKLLQS